MDEDDPAIISGEVEIIEIKPESLELLLDSTWSEEDLLSDQEFVDTDQELVDADEKFVHSDGFCFVICSGEVVALNNEDVVQMPFYLESYFIDNDSFRSRSPCLPVQQQTVIEIDRVTCYECDIVFCNEHRLLEHLMKHIEVHRMGCDICDKDLNLEEKFQLHAMAVTWQSVYYCDFCRKSCAGVVRAKSQPPPPGKIYMCHDCENKFNQMPIHFQNNIRFRENIEFQPIHVPVEQSQNMLPQQVPPTSAIPPDSVVMPRELPHTEVLQDQKQNSSETRTEDNKNISMEISPPEIQDCNISYKAPPKKKENLRCRGPKPRVQIVSDSMKEKLKMSTRSHTKNNNNTKNNTKINTKNNIINNTKNNKKKSLRNYKCRYCSSTFLEHNALISHLREKHKYHKLRYVCKLCGKDFVQQRCYENHLSFHEVSKNHMCFVCNLAFLSKHELEQHSKLHDKHKSDINDTFCENVQSVALDLRKKKNKISS